MSFSFRPMIPNAILVGAVLIGLVLSFALARPFIPAIAWSVTLAILFAPVAAYLERRLLSRGIAALLTTVLAFGIVIVPAVLVFSVLLNEFIAGAEFVTSTLESGTLARFIAENPKLAPALHMFEGWAELSTVARDATSWLAAIGKGLVEGSITGLLTLVMTFYFLFYLLRDRIVAVRAVAYTLPLSAAEFQLLVGRAVDAVHASVYGLAIVSAAQGALGGLIFWWLDLPSPVFWGVLMGLVAVLPFLGAFIIWGPAVLWLVYTGDYGAAAILAVWGMIVVSLIDNVLYPILVGQRLRLHSMISFIAILGGLFVFGASGIVLGPVIATLTLGLLAIVRNRLGQVGGEEAAD